MGIVAVLIQWQGAQKLQPAQVKTLFRRTLLVCAIALVALAAIETIAVVRVDVPAVDATVSFCGRSISSRDPAVCWPGSSRLH